MPKPIFLMFLFGAGTLIGQRSAARLSDRRDLLASFIVHIRRAALQIQSSNLPLYRLFDHADGEASNILRIFSVALSERLDPKIAWERAEQWALRHDKRYNALQPTDRKLLAVWAGELGRGFSAVQLQENEMIVAELQECLREAQTACSQKSRVYRAMGALCGAAIAILLV